MTSRKDLIENITSGTTWATGPCFGIRFEFHEPDNLEAQYRIEEVLEDYAGVMHTVPTGPIAWEILPGQTPIQAFTPLYHRCGEPWRIYGRVHARNNPTAPPVGQSIAI